MMTVMIERPRSATTGDSSADFEKLCRDLEVADAALPEGYRTEIIGGKIVMSPWSQAFYIKILVSLSQQLAPHVPEGHYPLTSPNLYVFPKASRAYGPDLHVVDLSATEIPGIHIPGSALSLVAEQTSPSTRDADVGEKTEVYGKSEVPVYVLVDMQEATVTVHHDPTPDLGYRQRARVRFGDKIRIPEPFDCWLDTAGWENKPG